MMSGEEHVRRRKGEAWTAVKNVWCEKERTTTATGGIIHLAFNLDRRASGPEESVHCKHLVHGDAGEEPDCAWAQTQEQMKRMS